MKIKKHFSGINFLSGVKVYYTSSGMFQTRNIIVTTINENL